MFITWKSRQSEPPVVVAYPQYWSSWEKKRKAAEEAEKKRKAAEAEEAAKSEAETPKPPPETAAGGQ